MRLKTADDLGENDFFERLIEASSSTFFNPSSSSGLLRRFVILTELYKWPAHVIGSVGIQ